MRRDTLSWLQLEAHYLHDTFLLILYSTSLLALHQPNHHHASQLLLLLLIAAASPAALALLLPSRCK
jgi:hypothetical protein